MSGTICEELHHWDDIDPPRICRSTSTLCRWLRSGPTGSKSTHTEVPTSEVLREWLDHNHLSPSVAAVVASRGRGTPSHDYATAVVRGVLDDDAVVIDSTAVVLARVTGIAPGFWLAFDHNYRTGMAAGKTVSK